MAITNFGQVLSSASANAVYLLKTEDDIITGILSLKQGTDINKHINNSQEFLFTLSDVLGVVGEADPNAKIYTSQEIIASGDNRKVAIGKLDAQVKLNLDVSLQNQTDIAAIVASLGQPNGIAQLDAQGRIPLNQLPDGLFTYLGAYDASTNTPALVDGTGEIGSVYRVTVAGTQDFGSGNITFEVEDKVVYNASLVWEKWDVVDLDPRPNVTNDAQLKREAGDFNTFTEKLEPVEDDIVLIEDSEDSFNKRTVKLSNLLGGSGQGGINYLGRNADAEKGLEDWANLANGTISINTVNPLSGEADFLLTQGSGVVGGIAECPFTIDKAGLIRKQYLSFDYDLSSTNQTIQTYPIFVTITSSDGLIEYYSRINKLDEAKQGTFLTDFEIDPSVTDYKINFLRKASGPPAPAISFNIDNLRIAPREITKSIGKTSWTVIFDSSLDVNEFLNEGNVGLSATNPSTGRYKIYYNKGRFPNEPIISAYISLSDGTSPVTVKTAVFGSDGGGDFVDLNTVGTSTSTDLSGTDQLQVTFRQKEEDQTAYQVSTDLGNRDLRVFAQGNSGASVTANTGNLNWTLVSDTSGSMWDGSILTSPIDGTYFIKGLQTLTAGSVNVDAYIDKNDGSGFVKQYRVHLAASATLDIVDSVYLKRGWKYALRITVTRTLSNSTDAYLSITKQGNDAPMLGVTAPQIAIFKDVKPSGTAGGSSASYVGSYLARAINTHEGLKTFASLDSNQITLEKGKYLVEASSPVFDVERAKIIFYNTTDSSTSILGSQVNANNSTSETSICHLTGVIELSETKTFELRQRVSASNSKGLGLEASFGDDEVYSTVKIQKIY